jgi:hypothetical protein
MEKRLERNCLSSFETRGFWYKGHVFQRISLPVISVVSKSTNAKRAISFKTVFVRYDLMQLALYGGFSIEGVTN